jgi:uncharacterized protein
VRNFGIDAINHDEIIHATRRWIERAVIGLSLCPFTRSVYIAERIRFRVSERRSAAGLLDDLREDLQYLNQTESARCETTLLIHPWVLNDFIEFNDFLPVCEQAVADMDLEGEIQVASFHPQYQFAGTQPQDIENYTNRSPYPTLHLLRESSVERALAGFGDPDSIYENNIVTLRRLGVAGWNALWRDASDDADA